MNKSSFTIAALVAIASAVNISQESQSNNNDDAIFPDLGLAEVADTDADLDAIFPDIGLAEVDSERPMAMAQVSSSSNW
jgi:hypothetical protein